MDPYRTAESWTGVPGTIAPADGNLASGAAPGFSQASLREEDAALKGGATQEHVHLGPNNERLEDVKPELVNALRELVRQYRQEGVVARPHEIRRIRQARLLISGNVAT